MSPGQLYGRRPTPRVCAAVALVATCVGIPLCVRGFNISDEGFILQEALELTRGAVMYRDYEAFVAPGIWYLVAALFKIVEPSVLATRFIALISYVAMAVVGFRIVCRLAGARSGLLAVLLFLSFTVWSFPAWTFAWYSEWALVFGFIACDRLQVWQQSERSGELVLIGILIGLCLLFKQNIAAFTLVAVLICLAVRLGLRERSLVDAGRLGLGSGLVMLAGFAAIIAPTLAYFAYHDLLPNIYDRFIVYPLGFSTTAHIAYPAISWLFAPDVLAENVDRYNYLAPEAAAYKLSGPDWLAAIRGIERLYLCLYLIPPVSLALGLWYAAGPSRERGKIDEPLLALTLVTGLTFLAVFPRADFHHLADVYPPVLLLLVVVGSRSRERLSGLAQKGFEAAAAAGVVIFVGLGATWYADLYRDLDTKIEQPRGGVFVRPEHAIDLTRLVDFVHAQAEPGEAVLMIPDIAGLNFLSGHPVPGSAYQLYGHMIGRDGGRRVARELEQAGTRLVISRIPNVFNSEKALFEFAPVLSDYLRTNFEPFGRLQHDDLLLLRRRTGELESRERRDVLPACAPLRAQDAEQVLAKDLLFYALHHRVRFAQGAEPLETRCRLQVPPNARLELNLGYRHPLKAFPGARLQMEIDVLTASGAQRILDREYRISAFTLDGEVDFDLQSVDLSQWSGQEVTLVLRTRSFGRVRMLSFSFYPFEAIWEDVRISWPTADAG